VEYFDSSEVFYTLYWGILSYRNVFCVLSFEVWLSAAEPPTLVHVRSIPRAREVDQSLGCLLLFDPHAPFLEKRRRGGECRTTLVWVSSDGHR
jgi:hypothetical protein